MEDFSFLTSVSEISPGFSGVSQGDPNSQNTVFNVILQDIIEKAEEVESLGRQLSGKKSNKTSRQNSNTCTDDYADILSKKGQFVEKLTEAVENSDVSLGIPKYTLHCYNMLNDLIIARNEEMKQDIQLNVELLKKQKHENAELGKELNIFTNLVQDGDEGFGDQDELQSKRQFEETKNDLVDILNIVFRCTNDNEKAEFSSFMSQLVDAYVNNLDSSVEDRYVQLPVTCIFNAGLLCLLQGKVVIQHPQDPSSFRLSVD